MKKSLFLCYIFLFLFLKLTSASTNPETPVNWSNGIGGQIENANQLFWLASTSSAWDEEWDLSENIDLTEFKEAEINFPTIGNSTMPFTGIFNGKQFIINHLYIKSESGINIGLFGVLENAYVKNITIQDAEMSGHGVVSGLAGKALSSNIENCHVTGAISALSKNVGGLIGFSTDNTSLKQCSFIGNIEGVYGCGGLIGYTYKTIIQSCYSGGNVTQSSTHMVGGIGGLIGILDDNSVLENSYSTASVTASNKCGGLIGSTSNSSIKKCYSTGKITGDTEAGAFIGKSKESFIAYCYIDKSLNTELSNIADNDDTNNIITELSSVELGEKTNFQNWDFINNPDSNSPWVLSGQDRPYLFWQLATVITLEPESMLFKGQVINTSIELEEVGFKLTSFTSQQIYYEYIANNTANNFQINFTDSVFNGRLIYVQAYAKDTSGIIFWGEDLHTPNNTPNAYGGGSGSTNSPFLLYTLDHLKILSESPEDWTSCFKLMANIDASDTRSWNIGDHDDNPNTPQQASGFNPIGNFEGNFDGGGHAISNLYINTTGNAGFIARGSNTKISHLFLTQCNITGGGRVGGIMAYTMNNTSVINCGVQGVLNGEQLIGGIVGVSFSNPGIISNCYSSALISGKERGKVGGIVGQIRPGGDMSNCYFNGALMGEENSRLGGIVSVISGEDNDTSKIQYCYVSGYIQNTKPSGIIVGNADSNCKVSACYYNTDRIGELTNAIGNGSSNGCVALSNQEFSQKSNFEGFNWGTNDDSPWLQYYCFRPTLFFEINSINISVNTTSRKAKVDFCYVALDFDINDTINTTGILTKGVNDTVWKDTPNTNLYYEYIPLENLSSDSLYFIQGYGTSPSGKTFYSGITTYAPTITIEFIAGENGSIQGEKQQAIKLGESTTAVEAKPTEGNHFVMWQDKSGQKYSEANPLVISSVQESIQLKAIFGINSYAFIGLSYGEGSAKTDRSTANEGEQVVFSIEAKEGYQLDSVYYNNSNVSTEINIILTLCGFPSPDEDCAPTLATYAINNAQEDGNLLAFFSKAVNDGIEEISTSDVVLYPNPATKICYIQLKEQSTIQVFNATGGCVQTHQKSIGLVGIKDLKPGVYVISIQSKHQKINKKVLFQ